MDDFLWEEESCYLCEGCLVGNFDHRHCRCTRANSSIPRTSKAVEKRPVSIEISWQRA